MDPATLLRAIKFAADKHKSQQRKGVEKTPYINHPIAVAHLLANDGGVTDAATLLAAILHDTVEDTETTPGELEREFGPEVAAIVAEVTDDKSLPKELRKELQVAHAPKISPKAKRVKLADKICNIRDVGSLPPADWSPERRRRYLDWAERVVAGCRGVDPGLEAMFDAALREARRVLSVEPAVD